MAFALVCAPRCADAHTHRVDDLLNQFPRVARDISTGNQAPINSTMSARVIAALSIRAAISTRRARSSARRAARCRSARALYCAARSNTRPRASARHCCL